MLGLCGRLEGPKAVAAPAWPALPLGLPAALPDAWSGSENAAPEAGTNPGGKPIIEIAPDTCSYSMPTGTRTARVT